MKQFKSILFGVAACAAFTSGVHAADHGDTPALTALNRNDGKITDWHAWHTASGKFVMSVCMNPAIPVGATTYQFPEDLTVTMHIDHKSKVKFDDPAANAKYGGTIKKPEKVKADITLSFAFDENGQVVMHTDGVKNKDVDDIQVFAGLRDDPFINGVRDGRNSACIVVQAPKKVFVKNSDTALTWVTSKIADLNGPISEHSGRALRSQQLVNDPMNTIPPSAHWDLLGLVPDVAIHRFDDPAGFPNGRVLTDDVIDQTMDPPFGNPAAQAATHNDKPFLPTFPYLAPPH